MRRDDERERGLAVLAKLLEAELRQLAESRTGVLGVELKMPALLLLAAEVRRDDDAVRIAGQLLPESLVFDPPQRVDDSRADFLVLFALVELGQGRNGLFRVEVTEFGVVVLPTGGHQGLHGRRSPVGVFVLQ